MTAQPITKYICGNCGSDNITADAVVLVNHDNEIGDIYDTWTCQDCGTEGDIEEVVADTNKCPHANLRIREVVIYDQLTETNGVFTIEPGTGEVPEREAWCEDCDAEFETDAESAWCVDDVVAAATKTGLRDIITDAWTTADPSTHSGRMSRHAMQVMAMGDPEAQAIIRMLKEQEETTNEESSV